MMNILIVDDEEPARGELIYILKALVPGAVFYEARNGMEALNVVETRPVEVVFLDINMPGMDGMEVAATIADGPQPPLIIFATAYDEHALRAIELAALDYVLKPFDERRLKATMERVQHALAERAMLQERQAAMHNYLLTAAPGGGLAKLWGERVTENRVLVDYADILWIEAQEKDVFMQTAAGERLRIRYTLKELEERLAAHNFARVHKAFLVNLESVGEVVPWFSGGYLIRMKDPAVTEIPMSRRYAASVKKLTGWR
jgi:DNA-binding LytR/AlgR family response regulator